MIDGYIRIKKYYAHPGDAPDDITEYQIYYDSIRKQYVAKFECGDCGIFLDWLCYQTNKMNIMMSEILDGLYCKECYYDENFDIDLEDCDNICGDVCECVGGLHG